MKTELSYCIGKLKTLGEEVDFQTPAEIALLIKKATNI